MEKETLDIWKKKRFIKLRRVFGHNIILHKGGANLNCAEVFAYRSTCIKRKYGAVIVKDDVVISTGYNGAPRGFENCCDLGRCPRIERDMHQGDGYGICRAIIQAGINNVYLRVGEGAGNYIVVPARELEWVQET